MSTVSPTTSSSSLGSFLSNNALTTIGNTPTTSTSPNLAVSGLASGMDWQTTVQELASAERSAEIPWQTQQTALNAQNTAFTSIKNDLATLQADIQALQDPDLYKNSSVQSSDSTIASGSTSSGAALGSFIFNISHLATAAQLNGAGNINQKLVPTGNPADVTIGSAGFATPVTAGTFTVNGAQVTIASTDTLQDVFNNIATATNNAVTASYDSGTDTITLTGTGEVVLGSGSDTSNFLQVAGLYNNTTNTITSNSALGRVQLGASMANADLNTAITDGGSGQGAFTVNGVTINYNASTDSIQNVMDRISNSSAGVTASYDSLNNRFVLTDKTTGDVGISVQDVTGNFAAATGLSGGTLAHGQNLVYTLNGSSQQLVSQSNTITSASSGITGLSVNALKAGMVTMSVSGDTSQVTSAVNQFITDYNSVQSFISAQQIVTTAQDGTVTPGTLTGDQTANDIASNLRTAVFSPVSGLSGAIQMLSSLGIQTNGQDNTLKLTDPDTLSATLANNLSDVQSFFTDATNGWGTAVTNFITDTTGDNGTLTNHQASLTQQSSDITTQIANLETKITSDTANWTSEFEAMETAESQANQELTYLSQSVTSGSL